MLQASAMNVEESWRLVRRFRNVLNLAVRVIRGGVGSCFGYIMSEPSTGAGRNSDMLHRDLTQ